MCCWNCNTLHQTMGAVLPMLSAKTALNTNEEELSAKTGGGKKM